MRKHWFIGYLFVVGELNECIKIKFLIFYQLLDDDLANNMVSFAIHHFSLVKVMIDGMEHNFTNL